MIRSIIGRLVGSNLLNVMKYRMLNFTMATAFVVCAIMAIIFHKPNFGIDFMGGISIDARFDRPVDIARMRDVLTDLDIGEITLQSFGSENDLSIRAAAQSGQNLEQNVQLIKSTISKNFTQKVEYRKIDYVGPQVGSSLIYSGLLAVLCSFFGIMIYVWLRFEWYFGLGVLITLLVNVILSAGFMSISQIDFNMSSIAGFLTIIGYSVNDSVVIYDRLRSNMRKFSADKFTDLINLSINETLSRTILTVLTTVAANLALVVYGGEAIYSFSMLVLVGILIGTYSSIFLAGPILTMFFNPGKQKKGKK